MNRSCCDRASGSLLLDDLIERAAVDVIHHEVRDALVIAVVEDADDVVVSQVGDRVGFVAEQPPHLRAHARVLVERPDRS